MESGSYYYAAEATGLKEWWPNRFMNLQLVSPFLHFLSSHYPYQELCKNEHPDVDPKRCAHVYTYFKRHDDYDRILDFDRSYFGYHDKW